MRKSICFVCLGKWDSIACMRQRYFGEQLKRLGWDVNFLIPDIAANETFARPDVQLIPAAFLKFFWTAKRAIRQVNPEYLHFLNPDFKATSLSLFSGKQKIIGDWEDWHAVARDKGLRKWLTRTSDWYMRRRCDTVITTSRWLQKQFQSICRNSPHYIPYAILPREFPNSPTPFRQPTAVFMGAFAPYLDQDILLSAALELKQQGLTPPIRMIGAGSEWESAKKFCEQHSLDNVELTGFLDWDDMLNNLRWAQVLLFPIRDSISNWSRCPFKVFQYAQARRPIITSAVGEVTNFLGDKATYIPCTPTAFAEAIRTSMAQCRPADVDYSIEQHNWQARTTDLVHALNS